MSDTGTTPMLRARRRRKEHGSGARLVRAVDWVDLDVAPLALYRGQRQRGRDRPGAGQRPAGGPGLILVS
jgi:hypothetical protein